MSFAWAQSCCKCAIRGVGPVQRLALTQPGHRAVWVSSSCTNWTQLAWELEEGRRGEGTPLGSPAQGGSDARISLLDWILTPIPGPCRPNLGAWICISDFTDADPSRAIGLPGAYPRVRGEMSPCPEESFNDPLHGLHAPVQYRVRLPMLSS